MKILRMDNITYLSLNITLMPGFYSKFCYWYVYSNGLLDYINIEAYEDNYEDY